MYGEVERRSKLLNLFGHNTHRKSCMLVVGSAQNHKNCQYLYFLSNQQDLTYLQDEVLVLSIPSNRETYILRECVGGPILGPEEHGGGELVPLSTGLQYKWCGWCGRNVVSVTTKDGYCGSRTGFPLAPQFHTLLGELGGLELQPATAMWCTVPGTDTGVNPVIQNLGVVVNIFLGDTTDSVKMMKEYAKVNPCPY